MKNLIYFCGMSILASAALSSCLFEEDNFFDESAALRGQHYTDDINSVLYTPENGWVMQYFANADSKGYNMYARFFENGAVILSSDHEYIRNNKGGALVSDTSTFVINEQDGPVLSFNSWNDILSVFTDPVDPGTLAEDGEGLKGDNEFVVMRVNENDIIMRGERHDAEVRLLKCDRPMDEFIEASHATDEDVLRSKVTDFFLISEHEGLCDTIFTYGMGDGVFDFTNIEGEDRVDRSLAFVCSPFGVRFQSVFGFDYYVAQGTDTTKWTVSSHEFLYSEDRNTMVSEEGDIVLRPYWEKYVEQCFRSNEKELSKHLTIQQNEGDARWIQLCSDLSAAITGAYASQSLLKVTFGSSTESGNNKRTGLCFQMNAKTAMSFPTTIAREGDVLTFDSNIANPSSNYKSYASKKIDTYFNAVAEYLNDSWKVTPDRYFNPLNITLTSTTDASKQIVVALR